LVLATHGRSFWVLDNLTPLRQVNTQSPSDVILYQPQTALRLHYPEEFDKRQPVGDNPPPGALIDYYFKTAPKEEVSLDIVDSSGKVVRHLSSKEKKEAEQPPEWPDRVERVKTIPATEGMNRFVWNLRYDDPVQIPGAFYSGNPPRGPIAMPGAYSVKLAVNGKEQSAPLELMLDPRVHNAQGLQQKFALAMEIYHDQDALHRAVNDIRDAKAQVAAAHKAHAN